MRLDGTEGNLVDSSQDLRLSKMEVPADLGKIFDKSIVKLDASALRRFNPRKFPIVQSLIDKMGKLSSEAQRLKRPLTTYDKLLDSADEQVLYILWEPGNRPNQSLVVGLLKVGYKSLYLFDRSLRSYKVKPLCILDFYVHTSKQRRGYGHNLYDAMLEQENVAAAAVAIDKPSESLVSFLAKHYGLTTPIWQTTNFVVYPQFFQILNADQDSLNGQEHDNSPGAKSKPHFGQGDGFGQFPFASSHRASQRGESVGSTLTSAPIGNATKLFARPSTGAASNTETDAIARPSTSSVSGAQMAKGRKIVSMDHQHLW